jgi:UDP:flavonoid glycosyltransferase YjiC (YdhE family)
MRIVFSTRPAFGHVYPLMPLAFAARDAGHEVIFTTTGSFLPTLPRLGFSTYDVGLSFEEAFVQLGVAAGDSMAKLDNGRPDPQMGGRLFIDVLAQRTALDLAPLLAQLRPDLVVYEQYDFGAAVAAHAADLPAVCHSLSPRMPAEWLSVAVGVGLDRLWGTLAMVPPPSFDIFTGDVYLDIIPAVLQQSSFLLEPARVVMRPIPFAEPGAVVPRWIGSQRRPLVYLTLGTVVATDEVLLPAIEGLATLDADVLLALGSADGHGLGSLPANVHVEAFVHQPAVLRQADLVVHHGGTGTILGALTHATPQVILPKGADQFLNADAMVAAGLASVLEPSQVTPDAVATAAKIALEEHRPAVDAVRDEIAAMPHPAQVLEQVIARLA